MNLSQHFHIKSFIAGLQRDPKLLEIIDKDFIRLIPIDLNVTGGRDSSEAHDLSSRMREFYIGPRTVSEDTIEEMINVGFWSLYLRIFLTSYRCSY